jgi:LysR family transcriptional activator of dmlA
MVKSNWDLVDLRVLCAVARRASFTAAAVDLGISVAYVTKRIAHLEVALATPLFLRTTRRVSITAQGETVYSWARKVLDAAEALDQQVASARGAPVGTLKVSTSHRLGSLHIAPVLGLLRQQHPGLEIWLDLVDRRVDLIQEAFDLDIRVGEVQEPHLVAHPIARSARVLCASPAYLAARGRPTTLADLARHDCLLFRDRDRPFATLRLDGPHGAESLQVAGPMGSNQSDAVRRWASQGLGIALLSLWDVGAELRDGSLERVLPAYQQPADIYAVMPMRSHQSAKLQVCLAFLKEQLGAGPYALDLLARTSPDVAAPLQSPRSPQQ